MFYFPKFFLKTYYSTKFARYVLLYLLEITATFLVPKNWPLYEVNKWDLFHRLVKLVSKKKKKKEKEKEKDKKERDS